METGRDGGFGRNCQTLLVVYAVNPPGGAQNQYEIRDGPLPVTVHGAARRGLIVGVRATRQSLGVRRTRKNPRGGGGSRCGVGYCKSRFVRKKLEMRDSAAPARQAASTAWWYCRRGRGRTTVALQDLRVSAGGRRGERRRLWRRPGSGQQHRGFLHESMLSGHWDDRGLIFWPRGKRCG